jgi:hypothetical protein
MESVDHTSTALQVASNARDMPQQVLCDTYERPLISAVSFSGKAAF